MDGDISVAVCYFNIFSVHSTRQLSFLNGSLRGGGGEPMWDRLVRRVADEEL